MAFQFVTTLDDLWEGDMESFEVGDQEILLIHLEGGEVVATQAICPHQETELVEGELKGCELICHAHLWRFDLKTFKGINPTHAELARYPVRLEGDSIFVDPDGARPLTAHS